MAFKSLFIKGRVGHIGLDVSTDALAAVQLEGVPNGKRFSVAGWSRVKLEPGIVHQGRILKSDKFVEALKKLFSQPSYGQLDGRHLILSLAEHQSYHKAFSVKRVGKSDSLVNMAHHEISQVVPFPIVEMQWDWQLVLEQPKYYHFYTLAVRKEVIEEYRQAFRSVNMMMSVIEPQVVSASRLLFEHQTIAEPVVYLEIGSEEIAVATIDQMGVHQSSVIDGGINSWISSLAKDLKVKKNVANKVLNTVGLRKVKHEKAHVIQEVIQQGLQPVIREIEQHKTFYKYIHGDKDVPLQSLMISGEGAMVPGIGEALSSKLKLDLRQVQTWAKFQPAFTPQQVVYLHNAIGAALRGLYLARSRAEGINVLFIRKSLVTKKKRWWSADLTKKSSSSKE